VQLQKPAQESTDTRSTATPRQTGAPRVRGVIPARGGYLTVMSPPRRSAVAASGRTIDDDGIRAPAGEVHAWTPGTNQTVCGLSLHRTRLSVFPHVPFSDVYAVTGGLAEGIDRVCPRCAAATGTRDQRRWTRQNPRP
jgi:hypothetical protein